MNYIYICDKIFFWKADRHIPSSLIKLHMEIIRTHQTFFLEENISMLSHIEKEKKKEIDLTLHPK
jgi:hypothetical protein